MKRWTAKELQYLQENVNVLTNRELASSLERKEEAIVHALFYHKIKRDPMVGVMMRLNLGTSGHPGRTGEKSHLWKGGKSTRHARRLPNLKIQEWNHPEKSLAYDAVYYAKQTGRLEAQPCEVCGETKNVHAHHDDYSKPLEVRWLCPKHHRALHLKQESEVFYEQAEG